MTDLGALRVHATGFGSWQTGAHGVGAVKMEMELSGGLEKNKEGSKEGVKETFSSFYFYNDYQGDSFFVPLKVMYIT